MTTEQAPIATDLVLDIDSGLAIAETLVLDNTNCLITEEFTIMNCDEKVLLCVGSKKENVAVSVAIDEELEVNVVDCKDDGCVVTVCSGDDTDATGHSSSFGGTYSGSDDEMRHDSSDAEVESNGPARMYGAYNRVFRKKRVSDHWRKFIHPLVWRSRWIELRMEELRNQALKYDRELAVYNQEKQLRSALSLSDNCAAREVSLTCRTHVKAMKRRKRKRIEETCNVSSYMSEHTIFSYYDKKPEADASFPDDGHVNQVDKEDDLGANFEWPMPDMEDNSKHLEQILLDIESLQSRVFNMTSQLNTLVFTNAGETFLTSGMYPVEDHHYSPSLSPRCSPVNIGEMNPFKQENVSPYASDFENEVVMPGSAVSSYGDISHPDIIESTVDLLSSAISCGRHALLSDEALDDVLINNQAADVELCRFGKANHIAEVLLTTKVKEEEEEEEDEGENFERQVSSSETETDIEIAPAAERAIPMPSRHSGLDNSLRRSKRKRKRKASAGSWIGEKKKRRKNSKKESR